MEAAVDLSIVIPCYNETDNVETLKRELGPVVAGLRRDRSVELVFVDDGSADGTSDRLQEQFGADPAVRIIRHDRNRGLGAAVRTGFAHATGAVVVTTDSDGTYRFSTIPDLLEVLESGADVVTASCYHPRGGVENVPGFRIFLSQGASLMYRVLLDWRIHTYTCLFRAYRRPVVEAARFESDGFLSQAEILAQAIWDGRVVG